MDLGSLAIDTLGRSLNDQLATLLEVRRQRAAAQAAAASNRREAAADLDGRFDAELTLVGPRLDRLSLDFAARGHLWWREEGRDRPLTIAAPLTARLQGPLWLGRGSFSLQNLPLALMALLTPVPQGLRGSLSADGRYSLGGRRTLPQVSAQLSLQDAALSDQPLALERGSVALREDGLDLDLSLRGAAAANSVDLRGRIPLQPAQDGLELRLATRGDGLRLLAVLAGPGLQWQQGSADLQLLVRGSLLEPVANGFLRFREGVLQLAGQTLRDLEATLLFDFRELELQQFSARVGQRGEITGSGQLALLAQAGDEPRLLRLQLRQAPFRLSRMSAQADGELLVSGSLQRPVLGGQLSLSRGSINVREVDELRRKFPRTSRILLGAGFPCQEYSGLNTQRRGITSARASLVQEIPRIRQLLEERWDFSRPLVVMGQQMESSASQDLREAMPNLPFLTLSNLRLRLGPDLRVSVPNVLNFNSGGHSQRTARPLHPGQWGGASPPGPSGPVHHQFQPRPRRCQRGGVHPQPRPDPLSGHRLAHAGVRHPWAWCRRHR